MINVLELRQQRAALLAQLQDVVADPAKFEAIHTDLRNKDKAIANAETYNALQASEAEGTERARETGDRRSADERTAERMKHWDAIAAYLRGDELTGEQRTILRNAERRDNDKSSGPKGLFTVPTGFVTDLLKAERAYGGVLEAPTKKVDTATGNDLPWPTVNDTGNKGRLIAEAGGITVTDVTFGSVTLQAFKYSSDAVKLSREVLQDSAFNLEVEIREILAERLGRIRNEQMTIGTGVNQPQGLVTGAMLGVTAASATAIALNELERLKFSVNRAYRRKPSCGWMMNDDTWRVVSTMKDSTGRPLLQSQNDPVTGAPQERLLDYPVIVNDDMASIATGNRTVLFGDMSQYAVRTCLEVTVVRLGELYAANDQVGFVAFLRGDGKHINAGGNAVKFLQQA